MAKPPPYNLNNKPFTTWLAPDDAARFKAIAEARGITVAAFLRAIVYDALYDEKATFSHYRSPSGLNFYVAHLK